MLTKMHPITNQDKGKKTMLVQNFDEKHLVPLNTFDAMVTSVYINDNFWIAV